MITLARLRIRFLSACIRFDDSALPQLTLFTEVDVEKNMKMFQYYANRLRKVRLPPCFDVVELQYGVGCL